MSLEKEHDLEKMLQDYCELTDAVPPIQNILEREIYHFFYEYWGVSNLEKQRDKIIVIYIKREIKNRRFITRRS